MKLKEKYQKAKAAKVGDECVCPSCNSNFIKGNYQQAFCKTKGGSICKDKYWNTVTPNKRNNKERISPASARWSAKNDIPAVFGWGNSQREIDREDRLVIDEGGSFQAATERCEWCECLVCRCDAI